MKKTLKILSIVMIIIVLNSVMLLNIVQAVNNEVITVYKKGDFKRVIKNNGIIIRTTHAVYSKDGEEHPIYCLNKELDGVGEAGTYEVTNQGKLTDLGLWRVISNAYPYKTIEQLGVADEAEAYIATKQSIYCYLYNTGTENYSAIGDAGIRVINAMNMILENAKNSTDSFENQNIEVVQQDKWQVDSKEKQYISKEYQIRSNININKIIMNLENQPNGTKITNLENQEKSEFYSSEKFKILIPINSLGNSGEFKIKIKTEMETKPVFFGKAPNENLQNYALTAYSYEDIDSEILQQYEKNETEIIIEKFDNETQEKLKGAKFEILNENNEVVKVEETNENGQIVLSELMPGSYYIKEINPPNGYEINSELFKVKVEMNDKQTIRIVNNKIVIEEPPVEEEPPVKEEPPVEEQPPVEEEPTIEEEPPVEEIVKLPVTGM